MFSGVAESMNKAAEDAVKEDEKHKNESDQTKMIELDVGNAERDADEVFKVINKAYKLEIGNEGVAFKDEDRLKNPLDAGLGESYAKGQVMLARRSKDSKIVG